MDKFLDPEEFSFDNIFKGRYLIPIYQRPYSWGERQVKQLLFDIDEAYHNSVGNTTSNSDDNVLFVGTMFIKIEANIRNEYTEYTVVDGQQRITTLTLLLMSLLNRLYLLNSDDDLVKDLNNYLWKKEDRKNSKDKRVLELGNIDKPILEELFDELYAKNNIVEFANQRIESNDNAIERNLLGNFLIINDYVSKITDEDELYDYIDYLRYNVRVISIKINTNMVKLFSIFESINSKGKPLDDIDLIKSFIFQNLDERDYDEYLQKWGKLIECTNDNLGDYFTVFIRANIAYYRTSIKLDNFKTLAFNNLKKYYEDEKIDVVLKALINDMLKQVKYYEMLYDYSKLSVSGVSQKALAVFSMNRLAKYNHTEPLFFKLLSLRGTRLTDELFDEIIEYAFRFILTFQTISSRESKTTIGVFSDVQYEIYKIASTCNSTDPIDDHVKDNIMYIFNKTIYESAISNISLNTSIRSSMTYRKNKDVVKLLLFYLLQSNEEGIDYLKLNAMLQVGRFIHVDHILPQTPDEKEDNFKYYEADDYMVLKPGHDFPVDKELEKMPSDDFKNSFLHRFGNLRLAWSNDNIRKSNHLIKLEEFDDLFNCYKCVSDREDDLVGRIIKQKLLISTDNYSFNPGTIRMKRVVKIDSTNYKDIEFKYYHPKSFTLFDSETPLKKDTFQQLLMDVFDTLYSLEKGKLIELAMNKYQPTESGNPYISSEKEDIRDPYILGNNVYIEKNINPHYMIYFFYKVLEEMGLSDKDLVVSIEER